MYKVFEDAVAHLRNRGDIQNFISDLLTPTEKIMLSKRLAIAVLLAKGYNYRQVCQILKISSGTINAVIKHQLINGAGYKVIVNKILRDEDLQKFFLDIEKTVSKLITHPGRHGSIDFRHESKLEALNRQVI